MNVKSTASYSKALIRLFKQLEDIEGSRYYIVIEREIVKILSKKSFSLYMHHRKFDK